MNIFLTGGTGFVGTPVLDQLLRRGHAVTALVRSESSAARVTQAGATALLGDITDERWLAVRLGSVDGAIHLASPGDATSAEVDRAVANAVVVAFGGTSRPYIHTGGVWAYGAGSDITEETPFAAPGMVAWRAGVESVVLDADVVASVIEPAIVYGNGGGIPTVIPSAPRTQDGKLTVLGDGTAHWATVHVDDLAALYVLVLESGVGAGYVLGASGVNPTVRELGEAASGGDVEPEGVEASRARLGAPFADALLLGQQATGAKAKSFGWTPSAPTLVDELRDGSYAHRVMEPS
jgi:nucleoside-diphosphate-sugar epimerase